MKRLSTWPDQACARPIHPAHNATEWLVEYRRYLSHDQSDGGLRIELADRHYPLRITLHYKVFDDSDVIQRWITLRHNGQIRQDDQLGGLRLTKEGLRQRDRLVIDAVRGAAVPLVVVLAGGYARRVDDTVAIHVATIEEALRSA